MATIKSYTDLSQSKTLAVILPFESADMYWFRQIDSDYFPPNVESIYPIPLYKDSKEDFNYDIPCWSLAALFDVIPEGIIEYYAPNLQKESGKYSIAYGDDELLCIADNPVDACYSLIIKLKERNLI